MTHNTVNSRSKHLRGAKTSASGIDEAVNRDLSNFYPSCDTAEFLERILPVSESCVETIFKALTRKSLYKDGRWAKIPDSNKAKEDELYGPFIEVANAISDEATTAGMGAEGRVNGVWVDRHNTSPKSPDEDAAKICPDCLYVSSSAAIQEAEQIIAQARDEISQPGAPAKDEKKLTSEIEKIRVLEKTKLSVWWRQVHIPVEIKPDEKHLEKAYTQICSYLRQVLAEQLDRRFVVGLVLCCDQLTVLLNDRSGILGTSIPIDIHKNPKQFVQVIASFGILEAHQIGWDTTMEVYNPATSTTCHSYQVGNKTGIFTDNKYHVRWVIDIPSRDDKGKREKIITVHTLSAARSVVGRATLVWEAVKYEERMNPTKIFVIKRYWRPYRNPSCQEILPSEGDRISLFGLHDDRLYAYEDIVVHDGKVDSTLEWIRKNIDFTLPSLGSLVHTQLIMSHSGWAIRHFKSRVELLQVILDGVRDHRTFYESGGVHRDVSSGNIIIMPTDDGETIGRLIDFDHAKVTKEFSAVKRSEVSDERLQEIKSSLHDTLDKLEMKPDTFDDEVLIKALQVAHPSQVVDYIRGSLTMRQDFFNFSVCGKVTSGDLHWDMADIRRPQFTDNEAPTGTPPYMSAEVLNANFHFLPQYGVFSHDAVHDMESFFWVVVEICLTRKGPGANMTRDDSRDEDDLDEDDLDEDDLREIIWELFDSDVNNLLNAKRGLLCDPEQMELIILHNFHLYFNELKPMVIQWWATLYFAYRFRAYEYLDIHNHIIDILEETITRVKQIKENPEDLEATQKEIDRREMHRNAILKMFVPKDPLKTPPPTVVMSSNVSPDPDQDYSSRMDD